MDSVYFYSSSIISNPAKKVEKWEKVEKWMSVYKKWKKRNQVQASPLFLIKKNSLNFIT